MISTTTKPTESRPPSGAQSFVAERVTNFKMAANRRHIGDIFYTRLLWDFVLSCRLPFALNELIRRDWYIHLICEFLLFKIRRIELQDYSQIDRHLALFLIYHSVISLNFTWNKLSFDLIYRLIDRNQSIFIDFSTLSAATIWINRKNLDYECLTFEIGKFDAMSRDNIRLSNCENFNNN